MHMKKIMASSLVGCVLFTSGVFADEINTMPWWEVRSSIEVTSSVITQDTLVEKLFKKYEIVLRNNVIEGDYKYNSTHYYSSKVSAEDIVIPQEIQDAAKKIYFLIEQGQSRIYFIKDEAFGWGADFEEINTKYNYKTVEYKKSNGEYLFKNSDLLKDFSDDEYFNVQITLIAEFDDEVKMPISNTAYVSIAPKKEVLAQLSREKQWENSYFWYYNSGDLELYLEAISKKKTREEYKKMLQKADKTITSSKEKNDQKLKNMLAEIKSENDFQKQIDTYTLYSETEILLSNLMGAVKNQIQNIRAFDVIDSILK